MAKLELTNELNYYNEHKEELLRQYKDKYIVIKNNEVFGPYLTEQSAYRSAVERFGNEPFLIKLVNDLTNTAIQAPTAWVGTHVA
jgi:hypothetical protein